jgi:hypothetical protein
MWLLKSTNERMCANSFNQPNKKKIGEISLYCSSISGTYNTEKVYKSMVRYLNFQQEELQKPSKPS